jgi:N-acetylmuramoyl-L-alanine amidase CwlA
VLIPSVSKYLFEDIDMVENMAEKGQHNRPGNVYEKRYICVHDTGDPGLGAKRWSEVVRDGKIGQTTYNASFQYVVGNDGYYHMIPDNEIAFHAGDGHTEESIFGVLPSGIFTHEYTKEKPKIEVNEEGYYLINGEKSKIKAPTNEQGEIKKKINDLGIYSELQKVENEENTYEYYLGRTWYNEKYGYISNYGGNLNSIGVESCVNKGSDVYYTWQKLAKLVAKLMDDNNFTIEQVVQHHYFSGKDCPWTKRNSGLWEYFKTVVLAEYQMLQYKKMGFTFEFTSESEYINEKGRIIKPVEEETTLKYKIKVRDNNGSGLEERFTSYIYPQES